MAKDPGTVILPADTGNIPVGPEARRVQSKAVVPVFACTWPDYYATMNSCDRDLYQWIERIPWNLRTGALNTEFNRIANATYQQQAQQYSSCEARRYAGQSEPTPGLRLSVASRLDGGNLSGHSGSVTGLGSRLSVHFAPGSERPPPPTCPTLRYELLHELNQLGINYYPQNTQISFTDTGQGSYWQGIGPWAGAKVFILWTLNGWNIWPLTNFLRMQAQIRSSKVFDHWATFRTFRNPVPPASLLARSEPFSLGALHIDTYVPAVNWNAPEGQRGHGWHVFVEYTHVESGESWVAERWLEYDWNWNPTGIGGYSTDVTFWDWIDNNVASTYTDPDGTWYHRICIMDFHRPPTPVTVTYNGQQVGSGTSSITTLMTTGYTPGVTPGIASVDETVTIYTVGATKASFRILDVKPVPGVGVLITIKVVNELHFAACIVTPFLSGLSNRYDWSTNNYDFYCPTIWVVRNLGANSESSPISILMPVDIRNPGTYDLLDRHWRNSIAVEAYPAPSGAFADGIYGGWNIPPYTNIANWPPPGYKITNNPDQYAFLLAGYRQDGVKIWHSPWDGTADLDRVLMQLPLQKAAGAEVPYVRDPRFGDITYPTYFDQVPFLAFVEWSAEYKVSNDPEVWEPRRGLETLGLGLPDALVRYGRYLTLNVAAGRPMWSPYYQKWVTVFHTWPGGNADELESYLVDQGLRTRFRPEWGWRNFSYTSVKKPFLTTGIASTFASAPFSDRAGYIQALTLIKESSSTTTFDVALVGYW